MQDEQHPAGDSVGDSHLHTNGVGDHSPTNDQPAPMLAEMEEFFRYYGWQVVPPFIEDQAYFKERRCYESHNPKWQQVTDRTCPQHHHGVDPECALSHLFDNRLAVQFGCQYSSRWERSGKIDLRHQPIFSIEELIRMLDFTAARGDLDLLTGRSLCQ